MLGYDVKDGKLYIEPVGAEIVKLIFHKLRSLFILIKRLR